MNIQIYTNTKLKTKEFIRAITPFSKENSFVETYNNGNAFDFSFSSETENLPSWKEMFNLYSKAAMLINFISKTTVDESFQDNKLAISTDNLENFIAERFGAISLAEFVFLSIEKDSIDIWTIINKLDRKVREKIYEIEYEILGKFKEFQFDFHVMCRDDRNIEEVRPSGSKMIFKK